MTREKGDINEIYIFVSASQQTELDTKSYDPNVRS